MPLALAASQCALKLSGPKLGAMTPAGRHARRLVPPSLARTSATAGARSMRSIISSMSSATRAEDRPAPQRCPRRGCRTDGRRRGQGRVHADGRRLHEHDGIVPSSEAAAASICGHDNHAGEAVVAGIECARARPPASTRASSCARPASSTPASRCFARRNGLTSTTAQISRLVMRYTPAGH